MAQEVESLSVTTKAIERLWGEGAREWKRTNPKCQTFPGMAVCVIKPNKLRARAVICGNFVTKTANEAATFTEQVDVTSLRLCSGKRRWKVCRCSVSTCP